MSSMSITSRRQIWSNHNPLRKQRSLADCNTGFSSSNFSIFSSGLRSTERTKFLQKQFSVDKIFNNNNNNNTNTINSSRCGRSLTRQGQQGRYDLNGRNCSNNNEIKSNLLNKKRINSACQLSGSLNVGNENTSDLGIFLGAGKKKSVLKSSGYGVSDIKKERNVTSDRINKKFTKTGDDKLNLNIFLDHSGIIDYNDSCSSDELSTTESLEEIQLNHQRETIKSSVENINLLQQSAASIVPTTTVVKPSTTIVKPLSAASRRAQFQLSREHLNNQSITSNISASPSLTISSRPPLIRAMSAPIRPFDENNKNIFANKRKNRRRKICPHKPTINQNQNQNNNNNNNSNTSGSGGGDGVGGGNDENNQNLISTQNNQKNSKSLSRTRCTGGCDVVTLVSLISSEGSDSEKEEITPKPTIPQNIVKSRAPTLRKTGKSVSFQENDIPNFVTATKEFPHMLRRGSVAPLAARIRANRPPTAPPVSIFISDFENSYTKMSEKIKSSSKEELSTTTKQSNQNNSKDGTNDTNPDNYQFPDYVRSIKERECWKLFQKMYNKGVCVSYDTVLRGMLTPTELRHLQKQREYEEEQKAKIEAQEALINNQPVKK